MKTIFQNFHYYDSEKNDLNLIAGFDYNKNCYFATIANISEGKQQSKTMINILNKFLSDNEFYKISQIEKTDFFIDIPISECFIVFYNLR